MIAAFLVGAAAGGVITAVCLVWVARIAYAQDARMDREREERRRWMGMREDR